MLMVAPERETPGTSARACAQPMSSASRSVTARAALVARPARAGRRTEDVPIDGHGAATRSGERNIVSAQSSSSEAGDRARDGGQRPAATSRRPSGPSKGRPLHAGRVSAGARSRHQSPQKA